MTTAEFIAKLGVQITGKILGEPINCGAGLSIENETDGGADDSYILISGDVTSKMYRDFIASLEAKGRKKTFHREINGNIFVEFENGKNIIYTYFG